MIRGLWFPREMVLVGDRRFGWVVFYVLEEFDGCRKLGFDSEACSMSCSARGKL
jgi:hypothetical protein